MLWQDLRYGLRSLPRSSGFSLTVVALVAIGVGVSTTVFSLLNPILLRPLPYQDPDRIICVEGRNQKGQARNVSHPDFLDWRCQATSFEELGCYTSRDRPVSVASEEPPEECCVGYVSDNFFRVFPVGPAVGRLLAPDDDQTSATPVAVLGHAFWRRHFGADPNVIGRSIVVDGVSYAIVGVTPAGFDFPPYGEDPTDVWVAVTPTMSGGGRANRTLEVLGKVKAGVSVVQAQAEMDTICGRLAAEYPSSNAGISTTVTRLHDSMTRQVGHIPSILMGSVLMVFLVACANVAGLMFARGVTREREMALRSALGGTRLRLMRLMLLENVVLALLGGCLGVLGATWAIQVLLGTGVIPTTQFPVGFFRPDGHVLGFALVLSILGAPACGLFPSLRCSGIPLARTHAAGSRSVFGSRGRNAAHTSLLATQIALTVVLLVAAGLMIRSLINVFTADRGFDSRGVLALDLQLTGERYGSQEPRLAFHRQLVDQLGVLPGVEKVGLTSSLFSGADWYFQVEGEPVPPSDEEGVSALYKVVSPGYFETMGIRLLRGRFFEERDRLGVPPVVIVDETLARRYWPDGNWVGRRIKTDKGTGTTWAEVIGVVGHVKNRVGVDSQMQIYQPLSQKVMSRVSVILRTTRSPKDFVAAVKEVVYRMDRQQLVSNPRTLDEALWYDTLIRRFVASLLAVSAGIALFLSAVGIYAVTRYSVSRRTQELGIRMALGASRPDVLRLVLRRALAPVLIGTTTGLAIAVAAARVMSSLLFELSPWDPATYLAVSLLLAVVMLVGCYLPARRAARTDPMVALRYE